MFYSYSELDRADHLRKQEALLKKIRHQASSCLVPVWQGLSLTSTSLQSESIDALMLSGCDLTDSDTVFLGRDESRHYFAIDISELSEEQRDSLIVQTKTRLGASVPGQFADLRSSGPLLSMEDGSLLAYARAMVYWNATTRFCYRCGSSLTHHWHGHFRQCADDACGYTLFPRTDPAVIMLVTYTPVDNAPALCLLGKAPSWPDGVFSTLAGFVEPGETLEMAVQREVQEETSITTRDIRYVASQPWPFPRSIMLGFEAQATSTEISCDPDELEDAQWFTRDQIKTFGSWGDQSDGYKLPRHDSIARHLIQRWLKEVDDD